MRRFLDAVLIALILVVLFGVVLGKVVPLTGRQTIIVGGGSMEPAVPIGAAIVVAPVAAADLHVGDVVSLRAGKDRDAVHPPDRRGRRADRRRAGSGRRAMRTRIPTRRRSRRRRHRGRVQLAIPLAGYLLALLSIPAGVLFLIGLAATLLAAVWLLESLELGQASTATGAARRRDQSPVVGLGEPIARPALPGRSPRAAGTSRSVSTIAEQLALSRETRKRRNRWQAGAPERADSAGD